MVAGRIGATADAAYAVTGDTVNTASRLQSAAPSGEILIGDATYQLTHHAFAFAPREEIPLKGKSEPVGVHRVLGPLAAPRSARGLEALGLAAPLVGRERELRRMDAAFDDMRAGRAQVLSLIGEPGAGKSRLQREFFARLEAAGRLEGTTIRRAACSALGEQTYGAVAALLRDAYGVEHGDSVDVARSKLAAGLETLGVDAEDRAAMVAALARVFGLEQDDARIRHLEPEQLKRQIFMATYALVERRLAAGPLVLVVEDLHWADAASIELLGAVADRLADRPLLVLLMYRPDARAGCARHEPDPAHRDRGHAAVAVRQRGPPGRVVRGLDAPLPGAPARPDPGAGRRQPAVPRGGGARAARGGGAGPRRPGVALHRGGGDRAGARHPARAAARAPGPARRRGATGHPGSGGDRTPLRGVPAARRSRPSPPRWTRRSTRSPAPTW